MPEIEVHAPPRGQQRHKTGQGREYTPTATLEAQRLIRQAWIESGFGIQGADREGAVLVNVTAIFGRPASHFGTGRNAGRLKASAMRWPVTRTSFDRDNLDKLVLDALSGYAFWDDSCVVDGRVRKVYARDGQVPGWKIGVFAMEDTHEDLDDTGHPGAAAGRGRTAPAAGGPDPGH